MSSIISKLVPMFDRILVEKIIPETVTKAGLYIPENSKDVKPIQGIVRAVGNGSRNADGSLSKPIVEVGDTVLLPEFGGTKIVFEDKEMTIYRETELIAKIK